MKQWYEELFENYANRYDKECFVHRTLGERDFIEEELGYDKKKRIIDIGCGTGRHSIELTKNLSVNGDKGIYLFGKNHIIERCTVIGNDNDGIQVSYGATITGNTCYDNVNDGINASDGATISGNTCRNNTDHGISLAGDNLVDQNTASGNGLHKDMSYCTFGTNHAPDPEPVP